MSRFTPGSRVRALALPLVFVSLGFPQAHAAREEAVVVTATRLPQTADATLASVTVITAEDIQRQQAVSVADVLRGVPGVTISRNGGPGKATSVFLRGAESDHVLVLIDGLRVGSASLGTFEFADLPVHLIERIEVVRGPRSSLYGSEAIGGVIQIFTRKGGAGVHSDTAFPWQWSGGLHGGSDQTAKADLSVAAGRDSVFFNAGVQGLDTQGYNSCRPEAATEFGGCFTDEPDDDAYRNLGASASLGYRFSPGNSVTLHSLLSDSDTDFDGSFQNRSEGRLQQWGVALEALPLDVLSLRLDAGRSEDQLDSFLNEQFSTRFETTKDSVSLVQGLQVSDGALLSAGADFLAEEVDSTEAFVENQRDNLGGFLQLALERESVNAELSLRHDENEAFGSTVTGGLGLGWQAEPGLRFMASYGTAFKAPSFNELYYPGFGNPDLQPEESATLEVGMQVTRASWQAMVSSYQTQVDELIGFDANFSPVNISKAKIKGLEASLTSQQGPLAYGLDLSWIRARNLDPDNLDKQLPRRPERSLKLHLDYTASIWSAGTELLFTSQAWDDLANTRELGAWQRVDLRGEYRLSPGWRLQARIENLFDTTYETASYYDEPGLTALLGIRYEGSR